MMVALNDALDVQEQIKLALRKYFKDAAIELRPATEGRVYIVIVSPTLDGKIERQKQDLAWEALEKELGAATQKISLVIAYSFDELFNMSFRVRAARNKNSPECIRRENLLTLVENNLRSFLDKDSLIHLRCQADCRIGVRVVSPTLNGRTATEKNEMIREASLSALREDAELLSFVVAYSTDEL